MAVLELSRSAETVQFLYCLMFTTSNIVRDNLFQDKVCQLDFGYSPEECHNLTHGVRELIFTHVAALAPAS